MENLTSSTNLNTPLTSVTADDNLLVYNQYMGALTTANTIYNYPIGAIGAIGTTGTYYYGNANDYTYTTTYNPLKELKYSVDFILTEANKRYLLEDHIKEIKKNKMIFNCKYEGNRIQPYEFIMNLIERKEKISVKVKVSDILTVCYTNLQFTKIENNLIFNNNCDFSVLKVKFKCEKILYENHKLSEKELRTDKLKKILKENE